MKSIKPLLRQLISGVAIMALLVLVMLQITMNFKILLALGVILFGIAGYINRKTKWSWLTTFIIVLPYSILFVVFVLEQIPSFWYFPLLFVGACALGLFFVRIKRFRTVIIAGFSCLLLILAEFVIPNNLYNDLSKQRNDRLPVFTLKEMSGESLSSEVLEGKVVILDFFGTWCKPCILELPELQKVKDGFEGDDRVEFFVINPGTGGDTVEKFQQFISANDYDFRYFFDENSKVFKQLEIQPLGLPTLLIVDKSQTIRYLHTGYNLAETGFADQITNKIETYLNE